MAPLCYRRHRFTPEIIQHGIWLYLRFTLSYRDVEELLAERGLDISYGSSRDSPLEGNGFEHPVPREIISGFEASGENGRMPLRIAPGDRRGRAPVG